LSKYKGRLQNDYVIYYYNIVLIMILTLKCLLDQFRRKTMVSIVPLISPGCL
jgi:hypothetical protein